MSALDAPPTVLPAPADRDGPEAAPEAPHFVPIEAFGGLQPISRPGGQGRVYVPSRIPAALGAGRVVVKLYRRPPPPSAVQVLFDMVDWSRSLDPRERTQLFRVAAWPLMVILARGAPVGIAMQDVSDRFVVPFTMPSGRRERVLLALEHLLGPDAYLQLRGLEVLLDTPLRASIGERISEALAYMHRHAIVVSDIAPSNLLVAFNGGTASVCFIDCDSMVFRGQQALPCVETSDWTMPATFNEAPSTRAADAYKLGLLVLRLFARSHDARVLAPHLRYVPVELRDLLYRALNQNPANRPPAGEWQRALGKLGMDRRLGERFPGPNPPPRAAASRPEERGPLQPPTPRAGGLRMAGGVGRPGGPHPVRVLAASGPGHVTARGSSPWLGRTVVALWILAGTIILFLVLARLFSAALPSQNVGGGPGFSFTPGQVQYPAPGGSRGGPGQGPFQGGYSGDAQGGQGP